MLSFTKRERVMLVILGIVVIFAGLFYFVYRPARNGLNALRDDLQIKEEERQQAQFLLQDKEIYASILESDQMAYEELRKSVLLPMLPEEIDALVTGMVIQCSLTPVDLSITLEPGDETDPQTGETLSSHKRYTVELSVKGLNTYGGYAETGKIDATLAEIIRLMDKINNTPGMNVREYTYEANGLDRPVVMTVDLFYFDEEAFDRENGSIEVTAAYAEADGTE